ncbi:hypothetical protein [Paenibacillus sp. N3.4]|uniref:hypothetical protein n=1 Tax=Paenibacillus sp. N3.4 TaxID=2603222 RepID=UPI0011C8C039|nr:hypothetical protein [Paenibacillus sp. N3.4]TXK79815.1 hypothetical protein FU659_19175 [Paenibacillus sp. N3.4]
MDHLQSELGSNPRQTVSPEVPNSNLSKEEALKEVSKDHWRQLLKPIRQQQNGGRPRVEAVHPSRTREIAESGKKLSRIDKNITNLKYNQVISR